MAERILEVTSNQHGYRKLRGDGQRYDALIPQSRGGTRIIRQGVITQKTVKDMWEIVYATLPTTSRLAAVLRKEDAMSTLENVWHFLHDNIQYRNDEEGFEDLRSPSRAWRDRFGGIDCDCFSIFCASLLIHLGFKPIIRIAAYDYSPIFQHVYVLVKINGVEIVLDPVLHKFNLEKTPTNKQDFMGATRYLDGLGSQGENETAVPTMGSMEEIESTLGNAYAKEQEEMFQNLIQTRLSLSQDASAFDAMDEMGKGSSAELVKILDELIATYGTAEFDALLENYIQMSMEGLGALKKPSKGVTKFLSAIKTAVKDVKSTVKTVTLEVKAAVKDPKNALQHIKNAASAAIKTLNKYNPIFAGARGLVILAMQHNVANLAKLFHSHLTRHTPFAKKLEKIWGFAGGDFERFKSACAKGAGVGLGVVGTAAAVTVGAPAATMLLEMVHAGFKEGVVKVGQQGIEVVLDSISQPKPNGGYASTKPQGKPSFQNTKPQGKPSFQSTKPQGKPAYASTGKPSFASTKPRVPIPPTGIKKGGLKGYLGNQDPDFINEGIREEADAAQAAQGTQPPISASEMAAKKNFFAKAWDFIQKIFKSKKVQMAAMTVALDPTSASSGEMPPPTDEGNSENERGDAASDTERNVIVKKGIPTWVWYAGGAAVVAATGYFFWKQSSTLGTLETDYASTREEEEQEGESISTLGALTEYV